MVLVTDFDGTLVRENSSRLLENLLIKYLGISGDVLAKLDKLIELLLLGFGKALHYKGDFKRYVILNLFVKRFGGENLSKVMKSIAEQLTVRELFKNRKFIVLSSAFAPIIKSTVELNNLRAFKIYASKLLVRGHRVKTKDITIDDKIRILKKLVNKYHNIVYCTDDIKEANQINKLEMIRVVVIR